MCARARELLDGGDELRLMLCREKFQGTKRGTSVMAACGALCVTAAAAAAVAAPAVILVFVLLALVSSGSAAAVIIVFFVLLALESSGSAAVALLPSLPAPLPWPTGVCFTALLVVEVVVAAEIWRDPEPLQRSKARLLSTAAAELPSLL